MQAITRHSAPSMPQARAFAQNPSHIPPNPHGCRPEIVAPRGRFLGCRKSALLDTIRTTGYTNIIHAEVTVRDTAQFFKVLDGEVKCPGRIPQVGEIVSWLTTAAAKNG